MNRSTIDKKEPDKQANTDNRKVRSGERNAQITLISVFCTFLAVFFALILILPKKEGELSQNERRMLAEAPDFTLANILNGGFAKQTDAWLQDHFPGRLFFVSFYSYANRITGRNATESIIAGKDGRLFTEPVKQDYEQIRKNAETLRKFINENGLNAVSAVIPSSGSVLENKLPALHRRYHDKEIIEQFNAYLKESSKPLDVAGLIGSQSEPDKYYYKTDHHLSMDGSYLLYTALAKELEFEPLPENEFQKTPYEFYGTSYGRSGLMLTPPDSLEIWQHGSNSDSGIIVTTFDGKTKKEHKGMIDSECLKDGIADKYAAYLYGNHGITSVVNPNVESGTLMLFKDSYANAVVPFLSAHYHEIIMIDTRYYNPQTEPPAEIVSRLSISDFVILCGTDTANSDVEAAYMLLEHS